jgi:tRNA nucleotidyltransferase (CCA-adding enzyme)
MPDYMYLLESRLSPEQRALLERVQELSRIQDVNIYLTGGAVRDLISGQPIRDLDFTLEGNPVRMVRELEKGGARAVVENERLRHYEMIFAGDVDGSLSAARDDYYERPGVKPEYRFSSIMEDLRRRDFSINAIAISLNTQSRGLLLDPTNGLADLEKQEVRALSIHSFTNQPVRILRILRYCARMGFKMESRTQEWFDLAMERGLQENIDGADVGKEIRSLGREDNPAAALKLWEARGLLAAVHPLLQRRKPDYERLAKLSKVRTNLYGAGLRPRLQLPIIYYTLRRLKSRESAAALRHLEFRSNETEALAVLVPDAQKAVKMLKSRKTNAPRDAYIYLAALPAERLAFIEVEFPNPRVLSKIRNYIQKWRPLRLALPVAELDSLGIPRGPKFDKILEQLFEMQLRGKGRDPESRMKLLRQLAGIKEEPKKKPKEEKKKRKGKESEAKPGEAKPPEKAKGGAAGAAPSPSGPAAAPAPPEKAALGKPAVTAASPASHPAEKASKVLAAPAKPAVPGAKKAPHGAQANRPRTASGKGKSHASRKSRHR